MSDERNLWTLGSKLHRCGAIVLVAYVLLHLGNHLIALGGVDAHVNAMDALRTIYRNPIAEAVLLFAALSQIVTGTFRVITTWQKRSSVVAWLQALSGLYIALFIILHVSAVLSARVAGVDTNFYFAAAGLHVPNWPWFFVPYYSMAVAAVVIHPACAAHWYLSSKSKVKTAHLTLAVAVFTGTILGLLIVATLAGLVVPVTIPAEYSFKL